LKFATSDAGRTNGRARTSRHDDTRLMLVTTDSDSARRAGHELPMRPPTM
jgi:hypothetical protein